MPPKFKALVDPTEIADPASPPPPVIPESPQPTARGVAAPPAWLSTKVDLSTVPNAQFQQTYAAPIREQQMQQRGLQIAQNQADRAAEQATNERNRALTASNKQIESQLKADLKQTRDFQNSNDLQQFKSEGVRYYTDPLTKRIKPVTDTAGNPVYTPQTTESVDTETGLPMRERRDSFGNVTKKPMVTFTEENGKFIAKNSQTGEFIREEDPKKIAQSKYVPHAQAAQTFLLKQEKGRRLAGQNNLNDKLARTKLELDQFYLDNKMALTGIEKGALLTQDDIARLQQDAQSPETIVSGDAKAKLEYHKKVTAARALELASLNAKGEMDKLDGPGMINFKQAQREANTPKPAAPTSASNSNTAVVAPKDVAPPATPPEPIDAVSSPTLPTGYGEDVTSGQSPLAPEADVKSLSEKLKADAEAFKQEQSKISTKGMTQQQVDALNINAKLRVDELNQRASKINELAQTAIAKADAERVVERNKMRENPVTKKLADRLDLIDKDTKVRIERVQAEPTTEEVKQAKIAAIQEDLKTQYGATTQLTQLEHENEGPLRDKITAFQAANTMDGTPTDGYTERKAKFMADNGITDSREFSRIVSDASKINDWVDPNSEAFDIGDTAREKLGGAGSTAAEIMTGLANATVGKLFRKLPGMEKDKTVDAIRRTSDGTFVFNPYLAWDEDMLLSELDKGVEERKSGPGAKLWEFERKVPTEEEKSAFVNRLRNVQAKLAGPMLTALQDTSQFVDWYNANENNYVDKVTGKVLLGKGDVQAKIVNDYLKSPEAKSNWNWIKNTSYEAVQSIANPLKSIGASIWSAGNGDISEYEWDMGQQRDLAQAMDVAGQKGFLNEALVQAASILPALGGGVVGASMKGLVGRAGLKVLSVSENTVKALNAIGETNKLSKLAQLSAKMAGRVDDALVSSMAKWTKAPGFGGSTGAAMLQSYGGGFQQAFQMNRENGMTIEDAASRAQLPAALGALSTGLVMAATGATGVESVFAKGEPTMAELVKRAGAVGGLRKAFSDPGFRTIMKSIFQNGVSEAGAEFKEEALDQFFQGIIEQSTYNPEKTITQTIADSLEAGGWGAMLGAGVPALKGAARLRKFKQDFEAGRAEGGQPPAPGAPPVTPTDPPAPIAPLPEDVAGVKAEVDQSPLSDAGKEKAQALIDVATGNASPEQLATLGIETDEKGKMKVGKTDGPAAVQIVDGVPVLTDQAKREITEVAPSVETILPNEQVNQTGAALPEGGAGQEVVPPQETPQAPQTGTAMPKGLFTKPSLSPSGKSKLTDPKAFSSAKQAVEDVMQQGPMRAKWRERFHEEGVGYANAAFKAVEQAGFNVQAHGMAKQHPAAAIDSLIDMFENGLDPNRGREGGKGTIDTANLTNPNGQNGGMTSGGTAYRDGPFILVQRQGPESGFGLKSMDQVAAILVNPALEAAIPAIQAAFPGVLVTSFHNVADAIAASAEQQSEFTKPTATPNVAPTTTVASQSPDVATPKGTGAAGASPSTPKMKRWSVEVKKGNKVIRLDPVDAPNFQEARKAGIRIVQGKKGESLGAITPIDSEVVPEPATPEVKLIDVPNNGPELNAALVTHLASVTGSTPDKAKVVADALTRPLLRWRRAFPGLALRSDKVNTGSGLSLIPVTAENRNAIQIDGTVINSASNPKLQEWADAVVLEEVIHHAVDELKIPIEELWNKLSTKGKKIVTEGYGRELNSFLGGHEFLRMVVQDKIKGKALTEMLQPGAESFLKDTLTRLLKFLKNLAKNEPAVAADATRYADMVIERLKALDESVKAAKSAPTMNAATTATSTLNVSPDAGARKSTPEGRQRVEDAKQKLRDIINDESLTGVERGDKIEAGRYLVGFLMSKMNKDLETAYSKGDLVAFTGEDAPEGFRDFVYLEGNRIGERGVMMKPEELKALQDQKRDADKEFQAGIKRVRESGNSDQLPKVSPTPTETPTQRPEGQQGVGEAVVPDLPKFYAEEVAAKEAWEIRYQLVKEAYGEGTAKMQLGEAVKPSTMENYEKVVQIAKDQGYSWDSVLQKVKDQLGLNDDYTQPESHADVVNTNARAAIEKTKADNAKLETERAVQAEEKVKEQALKKAEADKKAAADAQQRADEVAKKKAEDEASFDLEVAKLADAVLEKWKSNMTKKARAGLLNQILVRLGNRNNEEVSKALDRRAAQPTAAENLRPVESVVQPNLFDIAPEKRKGMALRAAMERKLGELESQVAENVYGEDVLNWMTPEERANAISTALADLDNLDDTPLVRSMFALRKRLAKMAESEITSRGGKIGEQTLEMPHRSTFNADKIAAQIAEDQAWAKVRELIAAQKSIPSELATQAGVSSIAGYRKEGDSWTYGNKPKLEPIKELDLAYLTNSQINKLKEKYSDAREKITSRMIEAGRGSELSSETMKKSDPLSLEFQAIAKKQGDIAIESQVRMGEVVYGSLPTTGKYWKNYRRKQPEKAITMSATPQASEPPQPSGEVGQRDLSKPEQMTPGEHQSYASRLSTEAFNAETAWRQASTATARDVGGRGREEQQVNFSVALSKAKAKMLDLKKKSSEFGTGKHNLLLERATRSKSPVSAEAVDTYGIKLPDGYVREGELHVYRPGGESGAPEFAYGMKARPFSIGAQPKGQTRIDENDKRARWGVIYYPRELTPEEVRSFELVSLHDPNQPSSNDFLSTGVEPVSTKPTGQDAKEARMVKLFGGHLKTDKNYIPDLLEKAKRTADKEKSSGELLDQYGEFRLNALKGYQEELATSLMANLSIPFERAQALVKNLLSGKPTVLDKIAETKPVRKAEITPFGIYPSVLTSRGYEQTKPGLYVYKPNEGGESVAPVSPKGGETISSGPTITDEEYLRRVAAEKARPEGSYVEGDPSLAYSTETAEERVTIQMYRDAHDVKTRAKLEAQADQEFADEFGSSPNTVIEFVKSGVAKTDAQNILTRRFITAYSKDLSTPERQLEMHRIMMGDLMGTRDVARSLQSRYDVNLTPAERKRKYLEDKIFLPSTEAQEKINKKAKEAREKAEQLNKGTGEAASRRVYETEFQKDYDNRLKNLKVLLAKNGYTIDDILNGDFEITQNSDAFETALSSFEEWKQEAIRQMVGGDKDFKTIAKNIKENYKEQVADLGKLSDVVEQTRNEFEAKVREVFIDRIRRGEKAADILKEMGAVISSGPSLSSAPTQLSDADVEAELQKLLNGMGLVKPKQQGKAKTKNVPQKQTLSEYQRRARAVLNNFAKGSKEVKLAVKEYVDTVTDYLKANDPTDTAFKKLIEKIEAQKTADGKKAIDHKTAVRMAEKARGYLGTKVMSFLDKDDPFAVVAAMRQVDLANTAGGWSRAFDMISELQYAEILSGVGTQRRNFLGGVASAALHMVLARTFEAGISKILVSLSNKGIFGKSLSFLDPGEQAAAIREVGRNLGGLFNKDMYAVAVESMIRTWSTEYDLFGLETDNPELNTTENSISVEDLYALRGSRGPAIVGMTGNVVADKIIDATGRKIRIPLRAMGAVDSFMKTATAFLELENFANRIARSEERTAQRAGKPFNFDDRVNELMADKSSRAWVLAVKKARYYAAQAPYNTKNPLERMLKAVDDALQKPVEGFAYNAVKQAFKTLFAMFIRTPYNLAKIATSFSYLMSIYHTGATFGATTKYFMDRSKANKLIAQAKKELVDAKAKGDTALIKQLEGKIEAFSIYNNIYENYPDFILNTAKTMIGVTGLFLLKRLSEGDDDDDKKKLLFISSRLPSRGDSGENLIRDVMTGGSNYYWRFGDRDTGTKVSINGMDPLTTSLALTADTLRVAKLENVGATERMSKLFGFISRLMEDKTYIRGLGNASKVAQGDMPMDQFLSSLYSWTSPNLLKEIARSSDEFAREFATGNVAEKMFPSGANAAKKINLAGEDVEKGGGSMLARYWWDFSNKVGGQPDWLKALGNWNQKMMGQKDSKNESATYGPTIQRNRDFDLKLPNGTVKKVELTTKQVEDYNMQVALMANRMLRPQFSPRDVSSMTEQKVKVIRDAWSDAKKIAREQLNRRLLSQGVK